MHEAEIKCREEKVTMSSSGPVWKSHYAYDIQGIRDKNKNLTEN